MSCDATAPSVRRAPVAAVARGIFAGRPDRRLARAQRIGYDLLVALGGRLAFVVTVAALALGGCGGCGGARSRERLGNRVFMDAAVPAWRVVQVAPREVQSSSGRRDAIFGDGSQLAVDNERGAMWRGDEHSPRWRIDWNFKAWIDHVAVSGDTVWVLVHSVRGASPTIAGTVVADGPGGSVAALVRVDASTGVATAARLIEAPLGRSRPTRLAVGPETVVASESGGHGGLWRIDPRTLATTAYVGLRDDAYVSSVDAVSAALACTHVVDHNDRTAAYVCFDAALREQSRVPLPKLPDKIWTAQGAVTGTVADLDRDLVVELAGAPPLWVSAVCRVAEERGIWDWLALYDKDGDRPPVVERCVDTRVIATSVGATPSGVRLLTVWAESPLRIGDHVVEIDGETLVLVEMGPELTATVSTYESCGDAAVLDGRWMVMRCAGSPHVVDLTR